MEKVRGFLIVIYREVLPKLEKKIEKRFEEELRICEMGKKKAEDEVSFLKERLRGAEERLTDLKFEGSQLRKDNFTLKHGNKRRQEISIQSMIEKMGLWEKRFGEILRRKEGELNRVISSIKRKKARLLGIFKQKMRSLVYENENLKRKLKSGIHISQNSAPSQASSMKSTKLNEMLIFKGNF
jgi:hypothetical protein